MKKKSPKRGTNTKSSRSTSSLRTKQTKKRAVRLTRGLGGSSISGQHPNELTGNQIRLLQLDNKIHEWTYWPYGVPVGDLTRDQVRGLRDFQELYWMQQRHLVNWTQHWYDGSVFRGRSSDRLEA